MKRLVEKTSLCCLLLAAGCGDDSEAPAAPSAWLGDEPHLLVVGTVDGETLHFDLRGEAAASLETLFCERNYLLPDLADETTWDEGTLEKFEIKWRTTEGGVEREYQLELLAHDFDASTDGAMINVVAYDEGDAAQLPNRIMAALEWEYEEDGQEVERGAAAASGTFTRGAIVGTPDVGVVVPDGEGSVGGYLHMVSGDGDVLDVSFTALCGDNDLDIP
ncbi:MAG: hypothetical protein KBB95_23005 [Deltaproteobacteria bacterium]|jgi:hypothetical protein|nr:hypothetical protein [Deltaproteobacteria bacterium]